MAGSIASLIGRALWRRPRGRFIRDERGATAVEFGILAVPFFAILVAIIETSIVFLSGQVLDSAVQDVSRLIRTGQAQQSLMTSADFKARICGRLYGLFDDCVNKLHVEVELLTSFNAATVAPPVDRTCITCEWTRAESYVPGQGSSIVMVQAYYKWPILLQFGALSMANLPDGRRLMGAATVFRNEPFI